MTRCPNCGSTAQFKEYGKMETEDIIVQIHTCGCGYRHQTYWKKDLEAGWFNGKLISSKKYKNGEG